ncbi:hypothetical protein CHS0354_041581 [Potamilus streckersoni]|uniref:Uncharacterized protein n=1 Tax=Potamilus streckersoni TaxID=2493646 RepID=A0AAE0VUV3_9BIVA|nr:hypothetical protein CHS0354_041581 [Potamilus streckersoni]
MGSQAWKRRVVSCGNHRWQKGDFRDMHNTKKSGFNARQFTGNRSLVLFVWEKEKTNIDAPKAKFSNIFLGLLILYIRDNCIE